MKNKIAILTDSTCDLPQKLLDNLPVSILPLKIIYSDKEYQDRIEIKPQTVYDNFSTEIPTTSMPSPTDAQEKLLKLKEKGYTHIIAIHISSGLSGTYNMVQMVSQQLKDLTIEVIDSQSLSIGLGSIVLYTANLIKQDLSWQQIINKTNNKVDNTEIFFVLKTLKYLRKGGRIGKVKGAIGDLLNIKPIISINQEGKYYTYKKARGRKRSINQLYKITRKKIKEGVSKVNVMHGNALPEAKKLLNRFKKLNNVNKTFLGQISPVMVVHTGPGLIGVVVEKSNRYN
ncbi:EDD domain protein, DegV family [Halobacteroides halobius DSM 5150]|uniref:EDD domain protein, DegV family n=1 Tax=Halobacteroides halobius (strain ATCC 35273 / DSM 5150 / MD-1) TaxID=748449 RepID=L0K9Y7_HALHC|nr:DegV family protein [Halobacteroides halobius]AGB41330.1 EDD domain protein, DegV family [Halobacteroides halobius DSM 5150]